MGCDGGTIPRRDELVRVKKKPEAKDKDSELIFQWRYCAITQQILQHPIAMCGLGKLYNKISLIESLLNNESMPEIARHIKGLKDIKDLNLSPNPAYKDEDKAHGESDSRTAPYICPVIGLEMSGKFRFVALWTCGCVFSERALKEIDTKNCHKCQKPFTENDVVVLNGTEEDLVVMRQRMDLRQQKNKKKREKNRVTVDVSASTSVKEETDAATSAGPSTVKVEVATNSKPVKSLALNATKRPGSLKESTHDAKKMKPTYSVAKDPKVTNVYKSIFTSHESEKQQNRAHWVTYNPFYN